MKLNKQISELVQTNFVPVEEANEGLLRGGFGEISMEEVDLSGRSINFVCKDENCPCPPTETTTTTPIPTTTPAPLGTLMRLFLAFLL